MAQYKKLSNFGSSKTTAELYAQDLIPSIKTVDDKKAFIKNNKVCVVEVFGTFCGPCKVLAKHFELLFATYNSNGVCAIIKEDVELGLSSNVSVVPTTQFFLNGNFDSVITGGDVKAIEDKINELLMK